MQSRIDEIRSLEAEVLAISVDTPEDSKRFAESAGLDYSLLSDQGAAVAHEFGVRHPGASIDGSDIARPAVFVIDRQGNVFWRSLTDNWRVRVRPETILQELKKLP